MGSGGRGPVPSSAPTGTVKDRVPTGYAKQDACRNTPVPCYQTTLRKPRPAWAERRARTDPHPLTSRRSTMVRPYSRFTPAAAATASSTPEYPR
jgi:hypothetical protein